MQTPGALTEEMMNMSKSQISLGTFLGFSEELQKIAASTSSSSTGTSQVSKPVSTAPTAPKLPKLVSKPQPPTEFAPSQDHIRSMKANSPPPVMM